MKASSFYRILSSCRGMNWLLVPNPKVRFGVPSRTWFIKGELHSFYYSPVSAVASKVRRQFVDISNAAIPRIINLDRRTFRRIQDASYQRPGHSRTVRRKLLRACGNLTE